MGPGAVTFIGIFGILMFLYWLVLSWGWVGYISGEDSFEAKNFGTLVIPAKYVPYIGVVIWFGALFFVIGIFNEIKNWFKKK